MKYKDFELDQFQIDAIEHINANKSVVVSAGTGTGKTLIADYLIEKAIGRNKRVIYTSPIKALSNQKYREFRSQFGDKVGLLTGDVSLNPSAQILIMTTEIYRNMLISEDPVCETIAYVIFDEIHYINDIERGTIWEESIIFSLEKTKILALSATIPNADELCDWIGSLRNEKVELVKYDKRAVPLHHNFFEHFSGLMERKDLTLKMRELRSYATDIPRQRGKRRRKTRIQSPEITKNQYIELVKELKQRQWMPCIFFSFSRKACEQKAKQLSRLINLLDKDDRNYIASLFPRYFTGDLNRLNSIQLLKSSLLKGIGIHHAGMLPTAKEIVETLFAEGKIKVLFATETFAVGINMPARAVCFSSLEKYDGVSFRYLTTKEYFQMAGRAGRRGIDKVGYAITLVEPDFSDYSKMMAVTDKDTDPIRSQYTLSFNTTINLLKHHSMPEIEVILKSNFGYFVKKKKATEVRIMASFNNLLKKLRKLGCIDEQNNVLEKGKIMSFIYADEVLITELVYSGLLSSLSPIEINMLIAGVIYEQRSSDHFSFQGVDKEYKKLIRIISSNNVIEKEMNKLSLKRMINIVKKWSEGSDFSDLMDYSNLLEGDYIRLYRQIIDRLQQIIKAGVDRDLEEKLVHAINLIDRDVVKVEF